MHNDYDYTTLFSLWNNGFNLKKNVFVMLKYNDRLEFK